MAQIDLLVIPSAAEPFGRILCEAAEAGVPVLLADSGGLGELSHRFGVGVRFNPGDVVDFIRRLHDVRRDYHRTRVEFLSGAQRLLTALDMDTYLSVMENLIRRAAAGECTSQRWLGRSQEALST